MKNQDSSKTFLILKQNVLKKLVRSLPQLKNQYALALQGKKVNFCCKLDDDINLNCNDQYLCVDLCVFFIPKGDTTGILRPTCHVISFNYNETT